MPLSTPPVIKMYLVNGDTCSQHNRKEQGVKDKLFEYCVNQIIICMIFGFEAPFEAARA
jgi:hypothetical protein